MDLESTREAADELIDNLIEAARGYGDNCEMEAVVVFARVRKVRADVVTGQTIIVPNVAIGRDLTESERRAYLAKVLEDAVAILRVPYVDPDELPSLDG